MLGGAAVLGACQGADAAGDVPTPSPVDPIEKIRDREVDLRARTHFEALPASDVRLGADPYALVRLPDGRFTGVLRGEAAVVLLDRSLRETARAAAPGGASSIALAENGTLYVVGDSSSKLRSFRVHADGLAAAGDFEVDGLLGARGVAVGPEGVVYTVSEKSGELTTLQLPSDAISPVTHVENVNAGAGAFQVKRIGRYVVVNALRAQSLIVFRTDETGFPAGEPTRIRHDGPFWGFDGREDEDALLIAAGGVEDHPLDRTIGSFGNIDSFVYLYRLDGSGAKRLAAINSSAVGLVTPKAVLLDLAEGVRIEAAGYGSPVRATLTWPSLGETTQPPEVRTSAVPPGSNAVVADGGGFVFANPLLDAWVATDDSASRTMPVASANQRDPVSRVGEALFFTTLMAPRNASEGPLSRFTCETCHHEGYVDGRIHHTGRGDVKVTTKPLLGLFNNRPHFSRALDIDLTEVAHNEFRVAGAGSKQDPWFAVSVNEHEWLSTLGVEAADLDAVDLRWSLVRFLADFTHRPNPAVSGRSRWSEPEKRGAEVFRDRCESCHQARIVSDAPASRKPFEAWEALIFAREGAIVWGIDRYEKTGVQPYVHERGARVPSLRRLYKKSPYLTNGSAPSLGAVLDAAAFDDKRFFHGGAHPSDGLEHLRPADRAGLLAFLDLL